jgi:hypothetical protein
MHLMLLLQSSAATGNLPPVATDTTAVLTASAVTVWLIQKLKEASWFKMLTPSSTTMNRLASVVAAILTATGIHVAFNSGTLTVTGLTGMAILTAGIAWVKSFVMNELIYQGIVNRPTNVPVTVAGGGQATAGIAVAPGSPAAAGSGVPK